MSGATSNATHGAVPAAVSTTASTLVMAAASSGGGTTTTTVLSSAQATQLLQRLQQSQGGVLGTAGGGGNHTIKIQAVQTHPQTGVRQIIAIPIHTTSAAQSHPLTPAASTHATENSMLYASGAHANPGKLTISPMKAKMSGLGFGPNVKVVKIASSANLSGLSLVQSTPTQVNAPTSIITSHGSRDNVTLNNVLGYGGTPGNGATDTPGSGSRKRNDIDFDAFSDAKRKKTEKGGKGLRHFSMKVCEKVQAKGTTSYNEVADELVAELTDPRCTSPTDQQYDQKNIRRRVYDALNVLMAMNIISKEKKEIRWLGLPTNSVQEANNLEVDKVKRMERIKAKTQQLQDLILQTIAFKNLVERNREREKQEGQPAPNSAIQLPFIIVNTNKKTVIDCSISNDKMEYLFNFDDTFEIHDDMEVLKRMGLGFGLERGEVTPENLAKARQMMPRALEQYVTQLAENGPGSCVGMPNVSDPVTLTYKNGDSKTPKIDSKSSILMNTQNQFANVTDFDDVEVN